MREKLIELLEERRKQASEVLGSMNKGFGAWYADHLIANDVTVQEHGYWETAVEVRDNTVCGDGVKIKYKRCSCCKNPSKFWEDDFCGKCGAKLDLPEPQKGE